MFQCYVEEMSYKKNDGLTPMFLFFSHLDLHKMAANVHADEMSSYNAKTVAVLCSIKCLKRFNKANNVM